MGTLSFLTSRAGLYVVGAVLALAAFGWFVHAQREVGRAEVRAQQTENALHNAEIRHEVEDAVRRAERPAADELRDEWGR